LTVIGQFLAACDLRLYCRTGLRLKAYHTYCRPRLKRYFSIVFSSYLPLSSIFHQSQCVQMNRSREHCERQGMQPLANRHSGNIQILMRATFKRNVLKFQMIIQYTIYNLFFIYMMY